MILNSYLKKISIAHFIKPYRDPANFQTEFRYGFMKWPPEVVLKGQCQNFKIRKWGRVMEEMKKISGYFLNDPVSSLK